MIYLDTHVLLHLYLGQADRLSPAARRALEAEDELLASPAALLELEYLHEIGRLEPRARQVAAALGSDLGLRICDLPFSTVVERALEEKWSRDPFDRLIVAQAKARNAALVTKDARIRRHYTKTVW